MIEIRPVVASTAVVVVDRSKGKVKAAKQFRLPGERRPILSGLNAAYREHEEMRGGGGSTAIFRSTGVSAGADVVDGPAEMADALLTAGVIRESDWAGNVERTIRKGLDRWVNDEVGMRNAKVLRHVSLVYADDILAYSGGMKMDRWREQYGARPDRPVGFFGFRVTSLQPRAVFVKDRILELEAVCPTYGYMLICMLLMTAIGNVNMMTFWDMRKLLNQMVEQRAHMKSLEEVYRRLEGVGAGLGDRLDARDRQMMADLGGFDETALTMAQFDDYIPGEASTTEFKLSTIEGFAELAATSSDPAVNRHAKFAGRVVDLWKACRVGGTTFHNTNHRQFISWQSTLTHLRVPGQPREVRNMKSLMGAPTIVTVWDERDPMRRLADDFIEAAVGESQYCDLTWLHAFQVGFSGAVPKEIDKGLQARDRMVNRYRKKQPGVLAWDDPEYVAKSMPDGSIGHAVKALQIGSTVLKCVDDVLYYLSGGEL